jgi:hypothetical protein
VVWYQNNEERETMKEYQFKIPQGVWLDVHADTPEDAVILLNSQLHLLDEPLQAPGRIQRVQVDVREPVSVKDIVGTFDLDSGESQDL